MEGQGPRMLGFVGLPHGFVVPWSPALLWLNVLSDSLIALAYSLIPLLLIRIARGRRDSRFNRLYFCFAAFILACGATHVLEVVTLWYPVYRPIGFLKAGTAAISLTTLVVLWRLVPAILALPTHEALDKANQQTASVLESTTVCALAVDSQWNIHYMNRNAMSLLNGGVDMRGTALWDAFPAQLEEERAILRRVMATRQPEWYESFYAPLDLTTTVQAHPWENGGVAVFFSDISGQRRLERELETSNRQTASVLESTTVCVLAMDSAWKIHYVNGNAKVLLKARGDMVGMTLWEAFPVDKAATRDLLLKVMETRLPASYEKYYEPLDLSVSVQAHPWENGGVAIFFTDISGQKRLKEKLETSNKLLASVLDNTELGLYAVDSGWKFQYLNEYAKKTLQIKGETLGTDMWAIFPGQQAVTRDRLLQAMETRVAVSFDSYYEPLDLSTHVSAHPWQTDGLTVYFTNISKERRLERELESANLRAASVLENTNAGIYAVDCNWAFRYVNEDGMRLLRAKSLLGKDMWESFPGILPDTAARFRQAMTTRTPDSFDSYYAPLDLWSHMSLSPWEEGGLTVCFTDISEQKRMQRDLDWERVMREQRLEVLARFSAGIAHEIKNPMAIIHARASDLAEMAEDGEALTSEAVRKTCDSIVKTSDRAMRILRGLEALAREGSNEPMQKADAGTMVEQAIELVQARYRSHGIFLKAIVPEGLPQIACREVQIGQVLLNLLNNAFDAIDASPESERWVRVEACTEMASDDCIECVQIDVVDGGPPLTAEVRAHLMEPFYTTKPRGGGIGIGLSVSRSIAADHGGNLELQDCDRHTCFRLTLPVRAAQTTTTKVAA
jgi:signal transduction histidine kinase